MALATAVTAVFTITIASVLSAAINNQALAERLTIASTLAQTKMSQLLSAPNIEPTGHEDHGQGASEPQTFGPDAGIYAGYKVRLIVVAEKINLQEAASRGSLEGIPLDDKIPAGVQNQEQTIEKAGSSESSITGGDVAVHRIIIEVMSPQESNDHPLYRVETIRPAEKPTELEP